MPLTVEVRSYATVADLREYLKQVGTESDPKAPTTDDSLQRLLNRAAGICDDAAVGLGFHWTAYADTASERLVPGYHGEFLPLPPHEPGSVTQVTLLGTPLQAAEWTITPDGSLRRVYTLGWWDPRPREAWTWGGAYWGVTAKWGHGPVPDSLVEANLEIAVNIWRSKDAGRFTNVVGAADGGAVGYEGAVPPSVKSVLQGLKQKVTGLGVPSV
jgi:hypothetical protein